MQTKFFSLVVLVVLATACAGGDDGVTRGVKTAVISPTATTIPIIPTTIVIDVAEMPVPLQLADYPPSDMPYYIENGDFWLVHTATGQLFALAPVSPPYADHISVDDCRYVWAEANRRFEDPCSGDKWELNGVMNLEATTEFWSSRNLDQYPLSVVDGTIFPQFFALVEGMPVELPLAQVAQYGVVVTAVSADLSLDKTRINTWVQADPVWEIDPNDMTQQLLTYVPFDQPSLLVNQETAVDPLHREGGLIVADGASGGVRQMMHNDWQAVADGTSQLTALLTVELSNLYRQFELPLDWQSHKPGDVWQVDVTVPVGYAALHVGQIEWLGNDGDDAQLRLTTTDRSPADLRLVCWQLDVRDPVEQTCEGGDGEREVVVQTAVHSPVFLYLRTTVELLTPFQLSWQLRQ